MLIKWNERSTGWFLDASEYTGYNRKMAALLGNMMPDGGTLCDLGCGMGLVDFELGVKMKKITCVDINADVIGFVKRRAEAMGAGNIEGICGDAREIRGCWDTVITLFHGKAQDFPGYLTLAGDRLIAVVHGSDKGNVGPDEYRVRKCENLSDTAAYLDGIGMKYTVTEGSLEYGQPLKTMDEARAYTTAYTKSMPADALEDYLKRNLQKTGREDFPYYLPNLKKFAIFTMERRENENIQTGY